MLIQFLIYGLLTVAPAKETKSVNVQLSEKMGSGISGNLKIEQLESGVQISGVIKGLKPNSSHGFHIHENADCSSADAKSAGSHFNPKSVKHGDHGHGSHAGDLGNIKADSQGVAQIKIKDKNLVIYPEASQMSLLNRSFIVHAKADDLKSQPSGGAGDRLACGVVVKK